MKFNGDSNFFNHQFLYYDSWLSHACEMLTSPLRYLHNSQTEMFINPKASRTAVAANCNQRVLSHRRSARTNSKRYSFATNRCGARKLSKHNDFSFHYWPDITPCNLFLGDYDFYSIKNAKNNIYNITISVHSIIFKIVWIYLNSLLLFNFNFLFSCW